MSYNELGLNETITSKVISYLRNQILVSKTYRKGDKLVESEIAEKLNISRAPVREALRRLESQGLVTSVPRRGTFVCDLSEEAIEEIYDLRYLLEGNIYETLVKNSLLQETDYSHLSCLIDQMVEIARSEMLPDEKVLAFFRKDIEFHHHTWMKAERPRTRKILTDLYHQLELGMLDDLSHEKNLEETARSHYKILEFLKKGEIEKLKQSRSWSLFARRLENIKTGG